MTLTEQTKQTIQQEFDEWCAKQYAGRSFKERQELGQFFTPPSLIFGIFDKLSYDTFTSPEALPVLDPTAGCGGLLAAAIIAGADPDEVFGVEIDPDIYNVCYERLNEVSLKFHGKAFNRWNLNLANTFDQRAYTFEQQDMLDIQRDYFSRTFSVENMEKLFAEIGTRDETLATNIQKLRDVFARSYEAKNYGQCIMVRAKAMEIVRGFCSANNAQKIAESLFPKYDSGSNAKQEI